MYAALIVEDEPLMRDYLLSNLNSIHNKWKTAACARDGVEAIELLGKMSFDAVITDIKMPRMDGLDLAAYISKNYDHLPVIVLTGYSEFDYARSAIKSGVIDFLLKPLREVELHDTLERIILQNPEADEPGVKESEVSVPDKQDEATVLVRRAREYILAHFCEPMSLNEVADALNVNTSYLSSIFRSPNDESYSKYVQRLRMERAATLLETHLAAKIEDIAKEVGFVSVKHFDANFKKFYGKSPNEYRTNPNR
ncbi:MAG: response regulator [Lachnospiraceae bacterium]|nr:response regulator [Lachnospiraceae bacterium]